MPFPIARRSTLLAGLALALVPAAADAALTVEIERRADGTCVSNLALRDLSNCQTKDLQVTIPAGKPIPATLQVAKASGCPTLPVIVRTVGGSNGSFSQLEAAPGATAQVPALSWNLGVASEPYLPSAAKNKLHVEAPFRECDALGKAFRLKVTFPTITPPSGTPTSIANAKAKANKDRIRKARDRRRGRGPRAEL